MDIIDLLYAGGYHDKGLDVRDCESCIIKILAGE